MSYQNYTLCTSTATKHLTLQRRVFVSLCGLQLKWFGSVHSLTNSIVPTNLPQQVAILEHSPVAGRTHLPLSGTHAVNRAPWKYKHMLRSCRQTF